MSPAHVLEPTYDALRRGLLTGAWPPGYRLEAARLADDMGVSITPVRDSLNRLTGERLVSAISGEGFRVPHIGEANLRDLLRWHHGLVTLCLADRGWTGAIDLPRGYDGIAERSALLFTAIAATTGSSEARWSIANAGARLGRYRRHEDKVLGGVEEELLGIESAVLGGARAALLKRIAAYHRRRVGVVAELLRGAGAAGSWQGV